MREKNYSNEIKTEWVENLALDELNMDESGVIHFSEYLDPTIYLEEASIKLMDDLREQFEIFSVKFNSFRSGGADQQNTIRIFKISNTVNDFMLFRNSLKLIVARKGPDLINISLISNTRNAQNPGRGENHAQYSHEIKAHVGPFNNIIFKYLGENIDIEALVRYYLTEFIKQSAR